MIDRQIPDIAIFMRWMRDGGAERTIANLVNGFSKAGLKVDLVLIQAEGDLLDTIAPEVRVIDLDTVAFTGSNRFPLPTSFQSLGSLFKLVHYLNTVQPELLLSATHYINEVALLARILSRVQTRVVVSEHTHLSLEARYVEQLSARLAPWAARILYPWADSIITVSEGVAQDLISTIKLKPKKIKVIYNPVIFPGFYQQSTQDINHPWLQKKDLPIILGAGRFVRQKDFSTLISAFSQVLSHRPARLVLLGDGRDRPMLEDLVQSLGLEDSVWMPGFMINPYAYLKEADVFVLSSLWEGLSNILIEAIALGTPVVATNCPSGPAEILQGGHYGVLAPVSDVDAIAAGILKVLSGYRPAIPDAWIQQFTSEVATQNYIEALGLSPKVHR